VVLLTCGNIRLNIRNNESRSDVIINIAPKTGKAFRANPNLKLGQSKPNPLKRC
jgi:filamentous hemagglutinin